MVSNDRAKIRTHGWKTKLEIESEQDVQQKIAAIKKVLGSVS